MSKPTILIITGAWHVPEHYVNLSHRLRHQGFVVECPRLETNNDADPPNKNVDNDVRQIRNIACELLERGKNIVALMHSYGGIVGTSALAHLGPMERKREGEGACVQALIYMAAFIPFEHESLASIFGGALPPFLTPNDRGLIVVTDPAARFYNDLTASQQAKATALLVKHPTAAQFESPVDAVSRAAWRDVPVTYVFCRADEALPLLMQEMMVTRVEEATEGLKIRRETLEASHSPFLSMPEKVAELVKQVCERSS